MCAKETPCVVDTCSVMAEVVAGKDSTRTKENRGDHSHQAMQDPSTTATGSQSTGKHREPVNLNAAIPDRICESRKTDENSQRSGESKSVEDASKLKGVGNERKDVSGEPNSNTQTANQRRGHWNKGSQEHGREGNHRQRYPATRGSRGRGGYHNNYREQRDRAKYRDNHSTEVAGQVRKGQRSQLVSGVKDNPSDSIKGPPPTGKVLRGQRSEFKSHAEDVQPRTSDGTHLSLNEFPLTKDAMKGDGEVSSDVGTDKTLTHPEGEKLGTQSKQYHKKPPNSRQPNRRAREERSPRQPRRAKDSCASKTRPYQRQSSTGEENEQPKPHPHDAMESGEGRIAKGQIDKNGESTQSMGQELTSNPRKQEAHDPDEALGLLSHTPQDVTSETSKVYKHHRDVESHNYTRPASGKNEQSHLNKKPRNRPKGRNTVVSTVQSDQLAQQLTAGTYECMVCCDRVKGRDQVWSCDSCYHVFHLQCIRKWATAPRLTIFEDERGLL